MSVPVLSFYDPATGTGTHLVYDRAGGKAAIIDPVLDYDGKSGRTSSANADRLIATLKALDLQLEWILETHAHADHLSAAAYLQRCCGGKIGIGGQIGQVQQVFKTIFHLEEAFACDGSQFDHLFADGEQFQIGSLQASVMSLPGHTPADIGFCIADTVFIGDTLFMPDVGSARCDFPGGDAHQLYHSVRRLLSLPDATRLFLCHDYPPAGRAPCLETSVAEQRSSNIHMHDGISEADFVSMRRQRDDTLDMPQLLLPSVQVNIRAGQLPPAEQNGVSYLKIPLNQF